MSTEAITKNKSLFSTTGLVLMALFAAITCVLAPISIPIGPVPISITMLVLFISVYVLGWKRGTITYIVYLLIGMVGLPVFSGWEGGLGKLAGPTGGYLIGFIPMVIVCGLAVEKGYTMSRGAGIVVSVAGMVVGTAIAYAFGTVWFCVSTGTGVMAALSLCVFPFLIGDAAKIIIAAIVGPLIGIQIRKLEK
ncbi:MAG: biotin transporter BioY [Eubacterium sp.]|nr:biotin transporter BioY [Eubacterium sp.]